MRRSTKNITWCGKLVDTFISNGFSLDTMILVSKPLDALEGQDKEERAKELVEILKSVVTEKEFLENVKRKGLV